MTMHIKKLVSTITGLEYPFARIREFADNGESLEVWDGSLKEARIVKGARLAERFSAFLPFDHPDPLLSLGEGNTPLLSGGDILNDYTGSRDLWLKNETLNPTWSFKDRGTLSCMWMSREQGEKVTATISTGNMGHSVAAYAARAGLQALVFVPSFTSREKIMPIGLHGATIIRVEAPDYAGMKKQILERAGSLNLRIVSGNGPLRVEGYKLTAFEMYEQMAGNIPDYIVVPVSACGHIRGIFKGYRELYDTGYITKLPKMVVVQAANNAPVASAIRQGAEHVIPYTDFHTVAEAITTGNPMGGDEIIHKAGRYGWLAEEVSEEEILDAQRILAKAGCFVEPASATGIYALRKLIGRGAIPPDAKVAVMLTGSGLKDFDVFRYHTLEVKDIHINRLEETLHGLIL
jgi:threonine synthase